MRAIRWRCGARHGCIGRACSGRCAWRLPPWQAWLLLGYVVLFVSIVSKLFYMEGVIAIGANRAALTMNLLPVFGALIGVAFFADEHLGGYVLIALLLVAAGIGLSERGARRLACPV